MRNLRLLFPIIASAILLFAFQSCSDGSDDAEEPTLNVVYSGDKVPVTGGSVTFTVESNTDWTVTKPSSIEWVTSISPESGKGNGTVSVTLDANDKGERRVVLTVQAGELTRKIEIAQEASADFNATLTVKNVPDFKLARAGEKCTFIIESNTYWTVTKPDDATWITAISPESGEGNDRISVTAERNTGDERSTTLTVTAGSITKDVEIVQEWGSITVDGFDAFTYEAKTKEYDAEIYKYFLSFSKGVALNDSGIYEGDGNVLQLEVNAAQITDGDQYDFPTGTFTLSTSDKEGTISVSDLTRFAELAVGKDADILLLTEGTVVIAKNGDSYSITMNLVGEDGGVVKATYKGAATCSNLPTPKADLDLTFDAGDFYCENKGDRAGNGTVCFEVELYEKNLGASVPIYSGWMLYMEIYAPAGSTELPEGTYELSRVAAPNTILISATGSLYMEADYNLTDGSFDVRDSRLLRSGKVTLTKKDESFYSVWSFDISFTDDTRSNITGVIKGEKYPW